MRKPRKQTFNFVETCFEQALPKKMADTIKVQNTREKQQFAWTNKLVG